MICKGASVWPFGIRKGHRFAARLCLLSTSGPFVRSGPGEGNAHGLALRHAVAFDAIGPIRLTARQQTREGKAAVAGRFELEAHGNQFLQETVRLDPVDAVRGPAADAKLV